MKTILLLGAKSQSNPLNAVPAELNRLKQLFTPQPNISAEYEPYLTRAILSTLLRQHSDQLNILHFAGHSSSEQLQTDHETVYAHHIARVLASWNRKPALLFLNGCHSAGQVRDFHQSGIPCVIATQNAIDDELAAHFAYEFYANLLAHPAKTTYQQAFDRAGALTLMDQRRSPRSLDLDADEAEAQAWDWGIYPAPDQADVLASTLFPATEAPETLVTTNPMRRIYQAKLENAQERWILISDWLVRVLKQYDTETREAEKIRMEDGIREKQAELEKIEADIAALSKKLLDA